MAINSVAANLLMISLVVGGIMMIPYIKQEVFPQFELEIVVINVAYPGASPEEVEQGILLPIEDAVQALDGVKEVRTTAREGTGIGVVELMNDIEPNRALADVKSAIDRITTFPKDVERPVVSLATNRAKVLSVVIYGDRSEAELRRFAEQTREELIQLSGITTVELGAVRNLEVSIEVPRERLRQYGLTLEEIANRIRRASVDIPGGGVKTKGGEILIRTTERRDVGSEFEEVVLLSRRDGTTVRVGDIATVIDGFRDSDKSAFSR